MSDTEQYYLRDIWYFALPTATLAAGKMLAKTICGEPILFARTPEGRAYALRDICPHRGIPLSDGRMVGGEVECCYHGWKFNGAGNCTCIPSLTKEQEFDLGKVKVKAYPVTERMGGLWIWMGEGEADESLLPVLPTGAGFLPKMVEVVDFPCFIDHAVIGLMDPAHGPYVHSSWWWRTAKTAHEKKKAFGPGPNGFVMLKHRPSSNSRAYKILGGVPETEIRFQLPGIRIEHITVGKHQVVNFTAVTPLDSKKTEITQFIYWTPLWLTLLRPILRPYVRAFIGQDKKVVVQQQRGLDYNPPLMLIKDADTMARWYYQMKNEYRRSREEKREFENPVRETVLKWRS